MCLRFHLVLLRERERESVRFHLVVLQCIIGHFSAFLPSNVVCSCTTNLNVVCSYSVSLLQSRLTVRSDCLLPNDWLFGNLCLVMSSQHVFVVDNKYNCLPSKGLLSLCVCT